MQKVSGRIVDVLRSRIYSGSLMIEGGIIVDIVENCCDQDVFILPGFVDSHCHIESSMMTPSEFARAAAIHGTVAVVSDPHEIANVLGIAGVRFMIENSKDAPVRIYYGAPSCVPATGFETSGAVIGPGEIEELLASDEIKYLAEVMNFPGVINNDPDILVKIGIAKKYAKPIDGHAPGLRGKNLEKYVQAGIRTDHECFTREEALEKIKLGMKVIIRDGSAAKNFDEFISLVEEHYESCMFCTDDKHPDDLLKGHIDEMVRKAIDCGLDLMKVLRVACVNPVLHYGMNVGLLQRGDSADFIVVDDLNNFRILRAYARGEISAESGRSMAVKRPSSMANRFEMGKRRKEDFSVPFKGGNINVIGAIDGQLITDKLVEPPKIENSRVVSDVRRDILKIAVLNRYKESKAAVGFVKNFGLTEGAIASSVSHDSHNVVAVGVTDKDICRAVNLIVAEKGGISAVSRDDEKIMSLPIAGLMSDKDYREVAEEYTMMNAMAKKLGSSLHAPFMTLSFMALPVIPRIKLSDMGLFDSERFEFISVFEGQ